MKQAAVTLSLLILILVGCGPKTHGSSDPKPAAQKAENGAEPQSRQKGFQQTLELQGIKFEVSSSNAGSTNTLALVPSGLEIDNSPISVEISGRVTGAEIADLNTDGSPEIYVYVKGAGIGERGSLIAYSANRKKSLSEIYLPPVAENPKVNRGYVGHEEFSVLEGALALRFPIYDGEGPTAKPTGRTRQLQYKLEHGEASWKLRLDKITEF